MDLQEEGCIMKRMFAMLLILIGLLQVTACGSSESADNMAISSESSMATDTGFYQEEAAFDEPNDSIADQADAADNASDRKIIKSASISMETTEFDTTIDTITAKIKSTTGYIESSNINGFGINADNTQRRNAYLVARIPEAQFDAFLAALEEVGSITDQQINGEDVTEQYFETESHLKALQIQEERMLELLSKAEQMEDILLIEQELTTCRTEIENLTTNLKRYDNLIAYNQVTLDITEVARISTVNPMPTTLGQRMENTFHWSISTLKNVVETLLVMLVAIAPFVMIALAIGVVIWRIRKKCRRKGTTVSSEKDTADTNPK